MSVANRSIELAALRRAMDGIDEAVAGLLATRAGLSRQAQELKSRVGLPAIDPEREQQIQQRYEHRLSGASIVARAILTLCRES